MKPQLILASASPRRRELLDQIGVRYLVQAVDIDETPFHNESPLDYVKRVAAEKSAACMTQTTDNLPVLSADTSVIIKGHILGKPENQAHAITMLEQLSGSTHHVYTAVSLRFQSTQSEQKHIQIVSQTQVTFRAISSKEMLAYWHTGEPQGKAGAYAIQGLGAIFVESITGSFSGVVGLPLFETAQLLSQQGIHIIT